MTHLEVLWQEPRVERFLSRVAGFSRLILMDRRGLGLSDGLTDVPTLDERVDDLLAVLVAIGLMAILGVGILAFGRWRRWL